VAHGKRRYPAPVTATPRPHPLAERLRAAAAEAVVVVAHRGDSRHHPENTLAAFEAAVGAGVGMVEFDVRATRDRVLVCLHDETLDRTTDAARTLGPGALVAQLLHEELQPVRAAGQSVPTLEQALRTMLPRAVPMVEHKAGEPAAYATLLQRLGCADQVVLQSFDWDFVAAVGQAVPAACLAVLGPTDAHAHMDRAARERAAALGASILHWHAQSLRADHVREALAEGWVLCTYTSDTDVELAGGAALGVHAMCTNDPLHALRLRAAGNLCRQPLRTRGA
jgi:glycerophosphoryl diester phosphodiesterase